MKETSARDILRAYVEVCGGASEAAKVLGVSRQYVYDLLHGHRAFSERMLKLLGLKRIIIVDEPVDSCHTDNVAAG